MANIIETGTLFPVFLFLSRLIVGRPVDDHYGYLRAVCFRVAAASHSSHAAIRAKAAREARGRSDGAVKFCE
jgi:hypothetical protein